MNGAEAILEFLKAAGITRSFGVVGESVLDFTDAVNDDPEFAYTPVRHEQAGALAASGYARTACEPAVCIGHIGAGASNLVNGIADASKDAVPVVALTGNTETVNLGRDVWHEIDHLALFDPVTEWNDRITHIERIPQTMREAMNRLNASPSGPIHLDLPSDVATAELPADVEAEMDDALESVPEFMPERARVTPPDGEVAETVDRFLEADSPIILAGGGTHWSGAGDALVSLAEYADVPVLTSLTARGIISEYDDHCFGALGTLGRIAAKDVADDADFLLAIGSELTDIETFGYTLFEDATIVQVNVDPGELARQYSIDQAVEADARAFLEAFETELRARTDDPLDDSTRLDRYRDILQDEFNAILRPDEEDMADTDAGLVSPYAVLAALGAAKETGDIVCSASGKNTLWSSLLPIEEPGTFLKSVGLGTMGFAFPAGMGAQLACPDSTVFVVIGDGDFSMTVQELETCVREDLPVIVVVFNDRELSSIKVQQAAHYGKDFIGVDYTDVDFATVAEGLGVFATRVETGDEFQDALIEALDADGPAVIDVTTDPDIEAPSLFYEEG